MSIGAYGVKISTAYDEEEDGDGDDTLLLLLLLLLLVAPIGSVDGTAACGDEG